MITKYQMISCLAEDTAKQIGKNGQEWTKYLTTAARLYKYPFNEQILIEQNRCAMACQGCGAVFLFSKKAVTGLSQDSIV